MVEKRWYGDRDDFTVIMQDSPFITDLSSVSVSYRRTLFLNPLLLSSLCPILHHLLILIGTEVLAAVIIFLNGLLESRFWRSWVDRLVSQSLWLLKQISNTKYKKCAFSVFMVRASTGVINNINNDSFLSNAPESHGPGPWNWSSLNLFLSVTCQNVGCEKGLMAKFLRSGAPLLK